MINTWEEQAHSLVQADLSRTTDLYRAISTLTQQIANEVLVQGQKDHG